MSRRALITGITGQDGSYLAEYLLARGYQVFGLVRRASTDRLQNLRHLLDHSKLTLLTGDMSDNASLRDAVSDSRPDEVYNLAAQSYVRDSWRLAEMTHDVVCLGTIRLLEAVRTCCPSARIYQASSSEMFGLANEVPQTERTAFHPRSPYAVAKLAAHWNAITYRESHGMHVSCGILFNHESPRRGLEFVTQKVAEGVARIHLGYSDSVSLGNLDARRDWGFAGDYVEAMWLMLQQDSPDDYVVGTGISHSVRDLLDVAFAYIGREWREHVDHDPAELRPAEVPVLQADPAKARHRLGWTAKMAFAELIELMIDSQIKKFDCDQRSAPPPQIEGISNNGALQSSG